MTRGQVLFTAVVMVALLGCAFTWPYRTQTVELHGTVQDSVLRGSTAKEDEPLTVCGHEGDCYVFKREVFRAIVKERNELKTRLEYCEKFGCGCR